MPFLVLFPVALGYVFLPFLFLPRYVYPLFIKDKAKREKVANLVPLILPLVVYVIHFFFMYQWVNYDRWPVYDDPSYSGGFSWMESVFVPGLISLYLSIAFFGVVGAASIPYYLFTITRQWWKKRVGLFQKIDAGLGIITLLLSALILTFLYILFGSEFDTPAGSRFFKLHAAVKNTCIVDPRRENCPKNVEEISYIEPGEYALVAKRTQMIYQYYPETGGYTFIVRYSPTRAVIFDPRLKGTSQYGVDFAEHKITTSGKDRFANPPSFDGPWDQIKEWDK